MCTKNSKNQYLINNLSSNTSNKLDYNNMLIILTILKLCHQLLLQITSLKIVIKIVIKILFLRKILCYCAYKKHYFSTMRSLNCVSLIYTHFKLNFTYKIKTNYISHKMTYYCKSYDISFCCCVHLTNVMY